MRKLTMAIAFATLAVGAAACSSERTVVRRETVQTETMPPPVVVEKHTIIQPEPIVPQQRVYEERKTTIESDD